MSPGILEAPCLVVTVSVKISVRIVEKCGTCHGLGTERTDLFQCRRFDPTEFFHDNRLGILIAPGDASRLTLSHSRVKHPHALTMGLAEIKMYVEVEGTCLPEETLT
jgi:hypothetical protein